MTRRILSRITPQKNYKHKQFCVFLALLVIAIHMISFCHGADGEEYRRLTVETPAERNRELEIVYRLPRMEADRPTRIMVLFGGRNWPGERTLRTYGFAELADRHNLVLLSPSFRDDEYWRPQEWSGAALLRALSRIEALHNLSLTARYYYGYSAGGQCANLFYFWRPEGVRAVGVHACGVWAQELADGTAEDGAPFLISCGQGDTVRFPLSYTAAQQLRDTGRRVVFRDYPGGHELNPEALRLAHEFFAGVLQADIQPQAIENVSETAAANLSGLWIADDFVPEVFPADSPRGRRIAPETANIFLSEREAQVWLHGKQ